MSDSPSPSSWTRERPVRSGVLLVNLGTPDAPETGAVRRYLAEFLSDPRVLDIPGPLRWTLLRTVILPFRSPKSAAAYRTIWGEDGSPLLVNGLKLRDRVRELFPEMPVELGMRYGSPSIARAMNALHAREVERLIVLPLYPQYASSSSGSTLERVYREAAARWNVPDVATIPPFYDRPGFIRAVAEVARPMLETARPDHVLLSYHGLPERHVRKSDEEGNHCLQPGCCDAIVAANRHCYRAQCYATSRALMNELALNPETTTTAFQSRLGRDPWIRPFTDHVISDLAGQGVKKLAVLCPSFVADCLETLEEIGIRAREQFESEGGEELVFVPCINDHETWAAEVGAMIREQLP